MEEEFSFKFPELDLRDIEGAGAETETLKKINEYLDRDMEGYDSLLYKLKEFERKIDSL